MINVSQEYLNAVKHYLRSIITRIYFNGSETPLTNDLISVKIKEVGQSQDMVKLGDFCTNEATIKFVMPSEAIPLEGGYFVVEHGVLVGSDYNFVPMGKFFINEFDHVDGSVQYTVTAYDCSTRANISYVPGVTLPTTLEAVVRDACMQCNIEIDDDFIFPNIEISTLYEGTCKETIQYMASLMGKNAKINRYGKLTFYWYKDSGFEIDENILYMDGFKRITDNDITIHSLTSGTEENVLTSGEGRGINFTNPYMTQDVLDGILEDIDGFAYTPSTAKYNGNPSIEIGDIVSVKDNKGYFRKCIVSEQTFILIGMHSTITSKGSTEENFVLKKHSPLDVKLEKQYNKVQEEIKNTNELLTGAKGGHLLFSYDDDGHPTGLMFIDTPTLTSNSRGWIFNKNGLGYSKDGFKTISNAAIDMNGTILANFISTGVLADKLGRFYLDMDNGVLKMKDGEFTGDITGSSFYCENTSTYTYTVADIDAMADLFLSEKEPTQEQIARYDINQNGRIDSNDALIVQKLLQGKYGNTNGVATFTDTTSINVDGFGKLVLERKLNGTTITRTEYNSGSINKIGGSITIDGEPVITEISGTIARFG